MLEGSDAHPTISYLTDVEGQWRRFESFLEKDEYVYLDRQGRLQIRPGDHYFVFGGDAVDRGPDDLVILERLVDLQRRDPRAKWALGNRDINKMRLRRALSPEALAVVPDRMKPWLAEHSLSAEDAKKASVRLRWILEKTMGAPYAFEFRREYLRRFKGPVSDDDVVASYQASLGPGGLMREYLLRGQLVVVIDHTLITHAALTKENFLKFPGRVDRGGDVRIWANEMNGFASGQIIEWAENRLRSDQKIPGQDLLEYQARLPGTVANQGSIVYARFSDATGNPVLPEDELVTQILLEQGFLFHLSGHTQMGLYPAFMKAGQFQYVLGDTSSRPDFDSPGILVRGDQLRVRLRSQAAEHLEFSLGSEPQVGLRTRDGYLVQGVDFSGNVLLSKILRRGLGDYHVENITRVLRDLPLSSLSPAIPCPSIVAAITDGGAR